MSEDKASFSEIFGGLIGIIVIVLFIGAVIFLFLGGVPTIKSIFTSISNSLNL